MSLMKEQKSNFQRKSTRYLGRKWRFAMKPSDQTRNSIRKLPHFSPCKKKKNEEEEEERILGGVPKASVEVGMDTRGVERKSFLPRPLIFFRQKNQIWSLFTSFSVFQSMNDETEFRARISSWKVGRVLGKGVYGVVRIATAKDDEYFQVAMKIVDLTSTGRIFLSVGTNTRESEELILNESQILRTFDHPNIVQLECTFIEDSYLISCLEYLDSDDLYSYVTRYAMNTKQIQNLFCQLCSAVSYCHSRMVVHGDLKCENILIRKHDKHLKVIDFGFSRCLRDKDGMLGVLGRTTQYAPPQDLHLTFAWDSWSVGVILFVMLKQRPPFALNQLLTGQMEDIVKTAKKVGNEQVFDILMSLWELDFRRRKLIVDLMSESPWLRETQHHHHHHHQQHHHHHHHHQQRERKDTITATATTPSSFSKPHSVQHYASCSSLMSFPPFLELPPPIVASTSCTPPNCFEEKKSLSFPQIASSPRSFILFEYAASGSSPSERDRTLRITKEIIESRKQEEELSPTPSKSKGKKKKTLKQKWKKFQFQK